jgi:predicted HTH transcriptional regulator
MDIVWQAEDSLKEKKTESDLKDMLKTLVAFANSVAPGDTATLLIGEKDDGTGGHKRGQHSEEGKGNSR